MKILFKEAGILKNGQRVEAGEEKNFPKKEAEAFINNGVAVAKKKEVE